MMSETRDPIFAAVLGDAYHALHPVVRAGHDVQAPMTMKGRARVIRGKALWPRLLAGVFGFPPAAADVAVTVLMTPQNGGELWERRFEGKPFWSFLKPVGGVMTERFGPLTFTIGLHVADGALYYPVISGRMGPVPLPRFLLPLSIAREYVQDEMFHFDVELRAPLTRQLMVHYQGWLIPEVAANDAAS
jgi:hypothetical protein